MLFSKYIPGTTSLYAITSKGEVVSYQGKEPKILKPRCDGQGYRRVRIKRDGVTRDWRIHVLVAEIFLGPAEGRVVDHVKGLDFGDGVENIRYTSPQDNQTLKLIHAQLNLIKVCTKEVEFLLTELEMK